MSDRPHPAWVRRLRARLDALDARGLSRALPASDASAEGWIDLRHNDYLGLRHHPDVRRAFAEAAAAGSGASRILGPAPAVRDLETRLASLKGTEDAVFLPTGYMANLAAMGALVGEGDRVMLDRAAHASLVDGARLATLQASGASWRTWQHGGERTVAVDRASAWASTATDETLLLVTESVFSMDGDRADLQALGALRDDLASRGLGCCLIVDDAHATGIIDPSPIPDVVITTAGKALGVMGGAICGPRVVTDAVVNLARPFIYSTGAMPGQAAAVMAAMDVMEREPERRQHLASLIAEVRAGLSDAGWSVPVADTPIIPLIAGAVADAMALSEAFREAGILAPAIRPPTVAPGTSRVRLSLHAGLSRDDAARILEVASTWLKTRRIAGHCG